jgi:2-C-methyl-D-erythritol 4-phosphate cytidylyltransferase
MTPSNDKDVAVILAGGSGTRMKGEKALKTFLALGTQSILQRTLNVFHRSGAVAALWVVLPRGRLGEFRPEIEKYGFGAFVRMIEGGRFRQESAYLALKDIERSGGAGTVILHDAVRPFVTPQLIRESISLARTHGAVETAVPVVDTLVEVENGMIRNIPDRSRFYRVQTPQAFDFALILEAHEAALNDGVFDATDDARLVMRLGRRVAIQQGYYENIKITTRADYALAKLFERQTSSGKAP